MLKFENKNNPLSERNVITKHTQTDGKFQICLFRSVQQIRGSLKLARIYQNIIFLLTSRNYEQEKIHYPCYSCIWARLNPDESYMKH